jgi:hypothetical protein
MTDGNIDAPVEMIEELATAFDEMCNSRMQFGQEKYGEFTWLQAPTPEMLVEELADAVNYMRMLAVKIRLMQMVVSNQLGDSGFTPSNPERE